jgi:predicted membrane GTPase involved in stress response
VPLVGLGELQYRSMSDRHFVQHELCVRLQVGPPAVITQRDENGKMLEPFDEATVDVPEEYVGACVDLLGSRKGAMMDMVTTNVRSCVAHRLVCLWHHWCCGFVPQYLCNLAVAPEDS